MKGENVNESQYAVHSAGPGRGFVIVNSDPKGNSYGPFSSRKEAGKWLRTELIPGEIAWQTWGSKASNEFYAKRHQARLAAEAQGLS
jgi:hypothetical protein